MSLPTCYLLPDNTDSLCGLCVRWVGQPTTQDSKLVTCRECLNELAAMDKVIARLSGFGMVIKSKQK